MDPVLSQLFFEDESSCEFNELVSLCLPNTITKSEDNGIYEKIKNISLNLALQISRGETQVLEYSNIEDDNDSNVVLLNRTHNEMPAKKMRVLPKKFVFKANDETSSEFLDSDIEDEQIQKFLRSRQKKRIGKRLSSQPDPRSKVMELRLLDHFEDKTDDEFYHYLRITKLTYHRLLNKIKEANVFSENYAGGNFPVQPEQAFQMFLYYMGNQCTYKVLSDMYHISESAIMGSFMKCVDCINRLDDKEVRWPSTPQEIKSIQNEFRKIVGFPGVVGSIGGCCVEMRTKREPPAGYKIGKLRSIMYLLGVTDAHLRFIYIQAGFPGTFSLQEAFESSSLGEMMKENSSSLFTDEDMHLIGRPELVLHKHLLVPFPTTGTLSLAQTAYNEKISATNVCTKAFSLLKNRFKSLETQVYANLEKIPNIIKACCIVHNIALKNPKDRQFLMKTYKEVREDYSAFRDDSDFIPSEPSPEAFIKRDSMVKRLFHS